MSLALSKKFDVVSEVLDFPLEVEIIDNRILSASRVHTDCVLEMFQVHFPIDVVPTSVRIARIIMGMDWLSMLGAMIECKYQLVQVQTPSKGELITHEEGERGGPTIYSNEKARRYLQHIFLGVLGLYC